jgi:hypothetical protein
MCVGANLIKLSYGAMKAKITRVQNFACVARGHFNSYPLKNFILLWDHVTIYAHEHSDLYTVFNIVIWDLILGNVCRLDKAIREIISMNF